MKRAAKQVLIVLLVVMAVIGTGNISAQADYNWKPKIWQGDIKEYEPDFSE